MPIEQYSELTKTYVEALMREGDNFDHREWFNKVIAEKRRSERIVSPEPSDSTLKTPTPIPGKRTPVAPSHAAITVPNSMYEANSKKDRLGRRLGELSDIWDDVREDRRRAAIYRYLGATFDLVTSCKTMRRQKRLQRRAFKFAGLPFDPYVDLFAGIIRCTTGGAVDRKTVSKWSRALRFVTACKRPQTSLKRFMKKMGGVNACASLYAQHFGRSNRVAAI